MSKFWLFAVAVLALAGATAAQQHPRIRVTSDVFCAAAGNPDAACPTSGARVVRWQVYDANSSAQSTLPDAGSVPASGVEVFQATQEAVSQARFRREVLRERLWRYLDELNLADMEVTLPSTPGAHIHNANAACNGSDKVSGFDSGGAPVCTADQAGGGSIPAGAIVLIVSGTCPATLGSGWAEETSLSGKFVLGTVAANADIAGTGGSDSITQVLNHTHPVSDPGHAHQLKRYPTTSGSSSGFTGDTSMSGTPANVTLPLGSATTGVTTQDPAGGVSSIDNRPAFVKVIFCKKQ